MTQPDTMPEQIEYDSKQKRLIHQLMATVFDSESLDQFSASYFRPVFDRFTPDMSDAAKIHSLIEQAAQHGQLGKLVITVQHTQPTAYQDFVERVQQPAKKPAPAEKSAPPTPSPPPEPPVEVEAPTVPTEPPPAPEEPYEPEQLLNQLLVDRYRLEEILDTSGRGAVFKAHDTRLDFEVAVKVIDLNRITQPALHERIRQEARTTMKLDHPGIVQVYDFGQVDSLLYIIMEFIPGSNLHQVRQPFRVIDKERLLPQLLELVRQLALTVDYMHQQGLLHPSLMPDNIMLKPSSAEEGLAWQPVLINFALLRPSREMLLSREAVPVEQLTYQVSPELLLGHVTDARSDVYELGILLYDLVVGQPPFRPRDLTEAIRLHVEVPPSPPRSINAELPEEVERVMLKALAKDPAERYLTAKELAQALADCLEKSSLLPPVTQADVMISTETAQPLVVTPGGSVTTKLTLRNRGRQDNYCQIRVQGVPANWVSISPSATTLSPGEVEEVSLTIQPPWSPLSRAGRHSLTIQVVSQEGLGQSNEVRQVLTVAPYIQFSSRLWPQDVSAGQVTQVTIENQGNTPETFTVKPSLDESLSFEPDQVQVQILPGAQATADFQVVPRRRLWVGKVSTQPFSFRVSASQGAEEVVRGQLTTQGMITPEWALVAALALVLCLCAALVALSSPFVLTSATETPTPAPPTALPTLTSTGVPTVAPPTPVPTLAPTVLPTLTYTPLPTLAPPTALPTLTPTGVPTLPPIPTDTPMPIPTDTAEPIQPPTAVINGPSQAEVGQNVTFDGSGSQAGSSNITGYEWNFGDGNVGSGTTVSHSYGITGTYQVTLMVTDENGATDSSSLGIQVIEPTSSSP